MRGTVKRIAIALPASLLLVGLGCSSAPPPQPPAPPDTGVVLLPEGVTLSAEPGGPPAVRPAANLALVLERRGAQTRLAAADGSQGWTGVTLPAAATVTGECPKESFALFRQSPDDAGFSEAETMPPTAGEGPLLGAARKTYPASPQQLMAPERLRVLLPVVRVRCGVEGYAPLDWMWLRYGAPSLDAVHGLVRRPFLGPFRQTLLATAPKPGSPAVAFLEDRIEAQSTSQTWSEVHGFYRHPSAPAQTLTIFGAGAARLYRFSNPAQNLLLAEYAPYPLRIAIHDGEWLVEAVSIFGDGAYSTLFHLRKDGSVAFHALSRSSGEDAQTADASWGWLDGRLWIARRAAGKVQLAGYRQFLLAAPEDPLDPRATAFPTTDAGWLTAIPFVTEKAAGGRKLQRYP